LLQDATEFVNQIKNYIEESIFKWIFYLVFLLSKLPFRKFKSKLYS